MAKQADPKQLIRDQILSDPDAVLNDREVMRALIAADGSAHGSKVVDLRAVALERLEERLDRLEDTHRHVIAAAYSNLASTNKIHRAVLALLEPKSFAEFLALLADDLAAIMDVNSVKLCLESPAVTEGDSPDLRAEFGTGVTFLPPGQVAEYLAGGGTKQVTMRALVEGLAPTHGRHAPQTRSEAILTLATGAGNLPGMLVLGSHDPDHFGPTKANDLLAFFASAFERVLQRWLV